MATPALLHTTRSALVFDPKAELAYLTSERRREKGQKTFILDPFGEFNKNYGYKTKIKEVFTNFNPFYELNNNEIKDYIHYIAEALIIIQGSDPHWSESSLELTEGLLAWMVEDPETEASLPNFRSILTKPIDEIALIATRAESLPEGSIAKRKLGRFADPELHKNKELCSIISTAITQTAFLDDPELNKCLSSTTPGFSLDCLVEEGAGSTIYLVLPFDKLRSHGRWFRLILSLAIRTVFRFPGNLENSVLFLLDEFGNIGPLPAVTTAFTMGAGRNILLWVFIQGLTQLKRDYPHDWEIFIGNCDHMTFFNIMDEFTADYLSKLIGTSTISITPVLGHSTQGLKSVSISGLGFSNIITFEAKYYARDLLQPSEIRRLPEGYGILVHRDKPPILYEKIEYYNDPLCITLAREDPYYKTDFIETHQSPELPNDSETVGPCGIEEEVFNQIADPMESIQRNIIVCLECGQEFKMLSHKHLRSHGLDSKEYKKKYSFSAKQPLCAKALSQKRSASGKERGLPVNLRKAIEARSKAKTPKD